MNLEWIDVRDRLPEIPKDKHAVSVLIAEFDPIYEELNHGHGHIVHECSFGKYPKNDLWEAATENTFMTLYHGVSTYWGPVLDEVTHWMYLPDPPKAKRYDGEGNIILNCDKGGICEWGIDGVHSNIYCKKCFKSKPSDKG